MTVELIKTHTEKKLSRAEFWTGIKNFFILIRGLDTSSLVFHSSTAKHLLLNSFELRNDNSKKVTNDIDAWVDLDLFRKIENILKSNSIAYISATEDKPLIPNQIAYNLKFNHRGVEYDIWTIEGKFDAGSPIGLSKSNLLEVEIPEFGGVKVLSPDANNRFMDYLKKLGDKKERTPV